MVPGYLLFMLKVLFFDACSNIVVVPPFCIDENRAAYTLCCRDAVFACQTNFPQYMVSLSFCFYLVTIN